MARWAAAPRLHILERNRDPRAFTLFVSGGAGPAHASAVARLIGVRSLIFPLGIGVASAVGALVAPLSFAFTRTYLTDLDAAGSEQVSRLYAGMEGEARRALAAAGVDQQTVSVRRSVDLRYAGQYHTLEVPLPADGAVARAGLADEAGETPALPVNVVPPGWQQRLRATFLERYRQRYGRAIEGLAIEAVNWKTTAEGGEARITLAPAPVGEGGAAATARKATRPAYFPQPTPGYVECPVYDRYRLEPGSSLVGPAIIEEREATIVLWPGDTARVDGYRNLLVTLSKEA
jgi:N-methylhydantoinase A/oxoprolinase/acetone carboxylase beta subunit